MQASARHAGPSRPHGDLVRGTKTGITQILAFEKELVLVAQEGQSPIRSANDLSTRTMLAFEPGCPHRKRLEDWFAQQGQMAGRVVEMSSYHALLGCAAAGMGAALMPRSVISAFPKADCLSVHRLPRGQNRARTVLIWRKGARTPRISALVEILTASRPVGRAARRKPPTRG